MAKKVDIVPYNGLKASLPSNDTNYNLMVTTDTKEMYYGVSSGAATPLKVDAANVLNLTEGFSLKNNGTALADRANLDVVGLSLFTQDADNNKIYLFRKMQLHGYLASANNLASQQSVYVKYGDYWYTILNKYVTNGITSTDTIGIFKTLDFNDWEFVVDIPKDNNISFNSINAATAPYKLIIFDSGDLAVYFCCGDGTDTLLKCFYYDGNTITVNTFTLQSGAVNLGNFCVAKGANGVTAIAGVAKGGGTAYWQLYYLERAAGSNGAFGTKSWVGSNPVRDLNTTVKMFPRSDGYFNITFLDAAAATSSKFAIAKGGSGGWTVYDSTRTEDNNTLTFANGDDVVYTPHNTQIVQKFDDSNNSFADITTSLPSAVSATTSMMSAYNGYLYIRQNSGIYITRVTLSDGTIVLKYDNIQLPIINTTPVTYYFGTLFNIAPNCAYSFYYRTDGVVITRDLNSETWT